MTETAEQTLQQITSHDIEQANKHRSNPQPRPPLSWGLLHSEVAVEAKALWAEVEKATRWVAKVQPEQQQAQERLHTAEAHLREVIREEAESYGQVDVGFTDASEKVRLAGKEAFDDAAFTLRLAEAQKAKTYAHNTYDSFLENNAKELAAEIHPKLVKCETALHKLQAEVNRKVQPLADEKRLLDRQLEILG
jgi:hypothetical protein